MIIFISQTISKTLPLPTQIPYCEYLYTKHVAYLVLFKVRINK